jgi:hypothetical protein
MDRLSDLGVCMMPSDGAETLFVNDYDRLMRTRSLATLVAALPRYNSVTIASSSDGSILNSDGLLLFPHDDYDTFDVNGVSLAADFVEGLRGRAVSFRRCRFFGINSEVSLPWLSDLVSLTRLDLEYEFSQNLYFDGGFASLQTLNIDLVRLAEQSTKRTIIVRNLPRLATLDIAIDESQHLTIVVANNRNLRSLRVDAQRVRATNMRLRDCRDLQSLVLAGDFWTHELVREISRHPSLLELTFEAMDFSDLRPLILPEQLKTLTLKYCSFTPTFERQLQHYSKRATVRVIDCYVHE